MIQDDHKDELNNSVINIEEETNEQITKGIDLSYRNAIGHQEQARNKEVLENVKLDYFKYINEGKDWERSFL